MQTEEYRTLLARASTLLALGRAEEAGELYRQLCASTSATAADHYQLANIRHTAGDLTGALHCLERAVALDPTLVQAWHMAGAINGMAGRHQDAANCFHKALVLQPQAIQTRLNLARALLQLGQWEAAAAHCTEILQQIPDSAQAWSMLGRSHAGRDQHQQACDTFRQALRLAPELAQAHLGLSSSLLKLGNLQEALQHQREAVRLNPGHAEAHLGVGTVLSQMGNQPEAVEHIRTALRLKPDFFQACITLAATLMTLGEPGEAERLCEQALALQPGNAEAISLAAAIRRQRSSFNRTQIGDAPLYVFHHIPKCGGTSILTALSNWFVTVADYGSGWTGYYPEKKNLALLKPHHCLCGHYEVAGNYLHQRYPEVFLSDRYRVITFVRDPLQVKMSLYRYELKNNVSQARSLEDHLFTRPNYVSERFNATQSNYREIVDKYFFVGILEQGQASLDLLARITGKARLELPWENKTTDTAHAAIAELSADCINQFRQENELDYLVYEYCIEKFTKLRAEYESA